MDDDALFAIGTALAALGGLLERRGVCTRMELAETLGSAAMVTLESGEEYRNRAAHIAGWAHLVRAAALGAEGASHH